jgi:hypothetical protein
LIFSKNEEGVNQIQKSYNSRDRKEKVLKEAPPEDKPTPAIKQKETPIKKEIIEETNSRDKDVAHQIEDNIVIILLSHISPHFCLFIYYELNLESQRIFQSG